MPASLVARNVAVDAVARLLDGGTVRVYDASGAPLVTLPLPTPCAPPAVDGLVAFHDTRPGTATGTGNAARVQLVGPSGLLVLSGAIGAEFGINGASIAIGAEVRLSGLTITED